MDVRQFLVKAEKRRLGGNGSALRTQIINAVDNTKLLQLTQAGGLLCYICIFSENAAMGVFSIAKNAILPLWATIELRRPVR